MMKPIQVLKFIVNSHVEKRPDFTWEKGKRITLPGKRNLRIGNDKNKTLIGERVLGNDTIFDFYIPDTRKKTSVNDKWFTVTVHNDSEDFPVVDDNGTPV